jgi:UDP-galactose transporter B1
MGFAGAMGQVFIYLTIGCFDCFVLTTITTSRKFLTVVISNFSFGHNFDQTEWLGAVLVLAGAMIEPVMKYLGFGDKKAE